jgi:hypothetical protein
MSSSNNSEYKAPTFDEALADEIAAFEEIISQDLIQYEADFLEEGFSFPPESYRTPERKRRMRSPSMEFGGPERKRRVHFDPE